MKSNRSTSLLVTAFAMVLAASTAAAREVEGAVSTERGGDKEHHMPERAERGVREHFDRPEKVSAPKETTVIESAPEPSPVADNVREEITNSDGETIDADNYPMNARELMDTKEEADTRPLRNPEDYDDSPDVEMDELPDK